MKNNLIKKYRIGTISVSVWKNTKKDDKNNDVEYKTISFQKSYLEGEEWKQTNTLNVEDLPKVSLLMNKAYEFIKLNEE